MQDFLAQHYHHAAPVLEELGQHARTRRVNIAIEPISHWETPGPNTLAQTIEFLRRVPSKEIGVVIDSAHETLDGAGPEIFREQVRWLAAEERLHYVQASPPDRGDLSASWLPWQPFFRPLLAHYDGPVAIEIFNALAVFAPALRLSRRKYWIPGIDTPNQYPSAYEVAEASLDKLRREFARLGEYRTEGTHHVAV
jgi:sugar phosphate isomerase/epimerase